MFHLDQFFSHVTLFHPNFKLIVYLAELLDDENDQLDNVHVIIHLKQQTIFLRQCPQSYKHPNIKVSLLIKHFVNLFKNKDLIRINPRKKHI